MTKQLPSNLILNFLSYLSPYLTNIIVKSVRVSSHSDSFVNFSHRSFNLLLVCFELHNQWLDVLAALLPLLDGLLRIGVELFVLLVL
jgi:hypothetical protein